MSRKGCKDLKPRKRRAVGSRKGTKATSKEKTKAAKSKLRAGNRKCTRCKVVFYKERGILKGLCPRCREHCKRCDVLLTEDNKWKPSKGKKLYMCKACKFCKRTSRDYMLVHNYGMTSNEYDEILKLQNGVCWICQRPPKEGGNKLAVDHLHSKGEKKRNPREKRGRVRGLLCWHCNAALGKFDDSVTKLRRAADYLERWLAQEVLKEK